MVSHRPRETKERNMSTQSRSKTHQQYSEHDQFKEKLILAAAEVIEEVGVDKLRLAEVAKRCGCVRQTVYRYFSNKKEITQAVLVHFTKINSMAVSIHVSELRNPEHRLVEIIYFGAKNMASNPAFKIFTDTRNSRLFSGLSAGTFTGFLNAYQFGDSESQSELTSRNISNKEMYTWITMQIMALVNLGMITEEDNDEPAIKDFIRKMIVRGTL